MILKRKQIDKAIGVLRNLTENFDKNEKLVESFVTSKVAEYYEENITSESFKQSEQIALRFKALANELESDSFREFCEYNDLYLVENDSSKKIILISSKTLSTYTYENLVVTFSHFQGDGFFKTPPASQFKGHGELESDARFYLDLYKEFLNERNPIKSRLIGFSMHNMDKKYNIHFRISDDYFFIIIKKKLLVFDTNLEFIGSTSIDARSSRLGSIFSKFKTVNPTSVVIFSLVTFLISNSILQFNIVSPYIVLKEYEYQIGEEFRITQVIDIIYDDNDPIRVIADNTPITNLQNRLREFNRGTIRIQFDRDQIDLNKPGTYKIELNVSDSIHSRIQTVEVSVRR